MNWLDIMVIIVAGIGLLIGWKMGFLGAIFNAIGVIVGIFVAGNFSDDIAAWITEQMNTDTYATVLSYVVIVVGVFVGAQVARSITKKMLSLVFLGWVDSLGSIVIGLVFGFATAGALILALARYSNDLPQAGGLGTIVQMTGIRGNIQDAMVKSTLIPKFIDATNAIPANALGLVPGDFRDALELLKQRIDKEQKS